MTHVTTEVARPREAVGPLIRGLAVLRALAAAGGRGSASGLVRETGLARSTVDRSLSTLAHLGYVRPDGRDTVLAPRLMELGNAYLTACGLPDLFGAVAERLAGELDESVWITVPDRDGVRFVHQASRRRAMSVAFRVGELLPAECGMGGALFAAERPDDEWRSRRRGETVSPGAESFEARIVRARRDGWALDDRLLDPGLAAVTMPVRDRTGRQVCAVNVVGHTSRHSAGSLREAVLPRLREAVAAMEDVLAAAMTPVPPPAPAVPREQLTKRDLGAEFVVSFARGLGVITALGVPRAGLPLTAVADATGLARATARRSLITLAHLGYVVAQDGLFRLTPRVLDLGFPCLSALTLPEIAQPHLAALVARVRDSASMAVLVGDDIQYVARVPTVRIMSVDITLGTRFPAHATSMGRVLLAGLPPGERGERLRRADLRPLTSRTVTSPVRLEAILGRADRDGYALVEEELEEGLRSVAVPVRDRDRRVVAAINVSMHAGRITAEQARESVLPPLRDTAARIERDLHVAGRHLKIRTS
ncbi:IclR family transcriptional regulator domain-containing protein [Actinoallomurus iriomotensis]|uniref:Transcriptional regulator n=1 Tax=Actinoallomurus iriomotensis TaxID=478107 RepID=A0A9W6S168_9ACTN|nr:transcriptional regulator [Actinoallomurus iriomotensis]